MSNRLWILGAADPEMERIEALLIAAGERVAHAQIAGERVRGGDAYRMDGHRPLWMAAPSDLWADGWYAAAYHVECDTALDRHVHRIGVRVAVIDHHRPGDPGYGRPPEEFLAASSIGQVIAALARLGLTPETWSGWVDRTSPAGVIHRGYCCDGLGPRWMLATGEAAREIPDDLVLAAAGDQCPASAYRGLCPGVDPDELMRWRVATRAAHQGRPAEEILADVERAMAAISSAPRVDLADPSDSSTVELVADLRGSHVSEAPEASLRLGVPILCEGLPDSRSGRRKVNLLGDAGGDAVRAFLGGWAEAEGLVDCYGDPARGFAGGYREREGGSDD